MDGVSFAFWTFSFLVKEIFSISAMYSTIIRLSGFSGHSGFSVVVPVPLMYDLCTAIFHLAYGQKIGSITDHE